MVTSRCVRRIHTIITTKNPQERFLELPEYNRDLEYHVPAKVCRYAFQNLSKRETLETFRLFLF